MNSDKINRLADSWDNIKEIVIYGYGRTAQRNIKTLRKDFNIKYIIDNNPDPLLVGFDERIYSFEEVKEIIGQYKIVVTTSSSAYESIKKDLEKINLVENVDFCRLQDFLPEWYWKNRNQVYLSQVASSITSRCTFKCKYCSMLAPYFKEHYDYTAEQILEDLHLLFQRVDYLSSYFILGGEPFLNKEIDEIVKSVHENYGDRIGYIQIITNGTIVPNTKTLTEIKRANVHVRVSDYSRELPYSKKLSEVIKTLENNEIEYSISDYKSWVDMGFPHKQCRKMTNEEALKHMLDCAPGCHVLNDKKLFFCGMMFSAEKCGLFKNSKEDYIDLERETEDILIAKKEIMCYSIGEMKHAISMCRVCNGMGSDNLCIVKVAEQVRENERLI